MKAFITLLLALVAQNLLADNTAFDTLRTVHLNGIEVVSSPKESGSLRQQPAAVTAISSDKMAQNQITELKGISGIVPNFFMPDYGSRLTSAVYIRGIGSRINTPAVGLYVDNVPFVDKSAFDFNFYDIERIDVLRGPQATMYGRNAMGGIVKVHTKNPFRYQGTNVNFSHAGGNNRESVSLTHYHLVADNFAFTAGGYYEKVRGFYKNATTGKYADDSKAAGGRIRAIFMPTTSLKLNLTASFDHSNEGAYPYFYSGDYYGASSDADPHSDAVGKITNNRQSRYRRNMFNSGLDVEYHARHFTMNAVTGFQRLADRMFMDQDFLADDTYTLEQKQRMSTLSEEVIFKSRPNRRWQWTTGVFGFYQWLDTDAPVTFCTDGMGMLNQMVGLFMPSNISVAAGPMTVNIKPFLNITTQEMPISGLFNTPVLNTAVFHQSTFKRIFGVRGLSLTAGLRLDYESMKIDYRSQASMNYEVGINGEINMSSGVRPVEMMPATALTVLSEYKGNISNHYLQLLPKASLQYELGNKAGNVYATVSRGHRSGGYNVQMFSDLMRVSLQNDMMRQTKTTVLEAIKSTPGAAYSGVIAEKFPEAQDNPVAEDAIVYKPEYTWNYEAGAHLTLLDGSLNADAAVFYMDTRNQQIARFANSGLGRMMVNAGRSRSFGAELAMVYRPVRALTLSGSYGYTNSKFTEYDDGTSTMYRGNYVPFVPMHTVNADAAYKFAFSNSVFRSLTLGLGYTGAGRIYWTEANDASQKYYSLLNARMVLDVRHCAITLWARNIADAKYNTFYFVSASRGFEQHGKPRQVGVDVAFRF